MLHKLCIDEYFISIFICIGNEMEMEVGVGDGNGKEVSKGSRWVGEMRIGLYLYEGDFD